MKSNLSRFASVLLLCLLLMSGQVFAVTVTYYSVPGPGLWLATGTWSNVSPCGASTGGGQVPDADDILIICNGSAVSVGAVSVGLNATVEVGGSLNLVTNVLTLTGTLTNNGGSINGIGAQAFVAQSIVHNGGITNLMGVTTNSVHAITVNATGLTLPTGLILIDNLFTSDVNFTMPGSVATITGNIAVTGGTLTLTNANNVTGNVVINDGAFVTGQNGGTTTQLPPTAPPTNTTTPTCPSGQHLTGSSALDYMCVADLAIVPTPKTCLSTEHLTTNSTGAYVCVANPATVPGPPTCLSSEHLTGSAGAYLCVPNPVFSISAPIFSIKEKARVFIEEVL